VPHLRRQRRIQQFAVGQPRVNRVAVGTALAALEAMRQVAYRAAALARK